MDLHLVQHNDIIRYNNYRYRVCAVDDNSITITRILLGGIEDRIMLSKDDTTARSWQVNEQELLKYGFSKLKNGRMHLLGVYWQENKLWLGNRLFPREVRAFHDLQHIVKDYKPNFPFEFRKIPKKK